MKTPRIGYLPFYVDYYESICPDFPREKKAVAERCARALARHGEVVWDGELIGDAQSAAAAGEALAAARVDCAVAVTTIAVFGAIPWAALRQIDAPLLIWNAQQIRTVERGYSMVEIVRNTGQIGTQALANTLLREGRWFRVVTGYEGSRECDDELGRFFAVVRAVRAVRTARLLAIGAPFPMMTDILIDEEELARRLGPAVTRASAAELTVACERVPREAVDAHVAAMRDAYDLQELSAGELERSARLCEAVEALANAAQAAGGSLNCHGENCLRNEAIGITACYSLGVQNSRGRPFTCTGDLPTALALVMLKNLTGMAMYTEVQVMDEQREAIVIANSGEGEDGIRRGGGKPLVRGNTNFAGVRGRGASFAYALKAGPATVASLTPTPRGPKPYRLIAAEGEILPDTLPDAGALAGFFRFAKGGLRDRYRAWLEAGAVHHAGTAMGHWARELRMIAELLDLELVEI